MHCQVSIFGPASFAMGWLGRTKDEIGAVCAMAGLLVGVGGFTLTIYQLHSAATALRAANAYQIQKDARELTEKLVDDPKFMDAMRVGTTPQNESYFLNKLWRVFNFYLAVYRQRRGDGLSSEFTASFRDDFCQFMANKNVKDGWNKLLANKQISADNVEMREAWCDKD